MDDDLLGDDFDDDLLDDDLDDELPEEPLSEFAKQLRPSMLNILKMLVEAELIEFEDEKKEELVKEMSQAAENARRPKAILKAVLYALIESDNVEEVYGNDSELMIVIKKAVS